MQKRWTKVIAGILLFSICASIAGCKRKKKISFEKLERSTFSIALRDVGIEAENLVELTTDDSAKYQILTKTFGEGSSYALLAEYNEMVFSYTEYSSPYFAHQFFTSYFTMYDDVSRSKKNEEIQTHIEDEFGYVLINYMKGNKQIYGGFYLIDNTVIVVSNSQSEHVYSDQAFIDKFLGLINYPTP